MEKLPTEIILKQILEMNFDDIVNFCKTNKDINSICKKNKDYIMRNYLKRNYNINYPIKSSTFDYIRKVNLDEWKLHPQNNLIHLVMEGKIEKLTELIQIFYKLKSLGIVENEDETSRFFNLKEEITYYLVNNFFGSKQTFKEHVYKKMNIDNNGMVKIEILTDLENEQTFINDALEKFREIISNQKEAFEKINNVYNRYKQQTKTETLENLQGRIQEEDSVYFNFLNFKLDIHKLLIDPKFKDLINYGIKIKDIIIMFGSLDLIKTFLPTEFNQTRSSAKMTALLRGDLDIIDWIVLDLDGFQRSKSYFRRMGVQENIIDELDRKFGLPR